MKKIIVLSFVAVVLSIASSAHALVVPTAGGYEVSYTFDLKAGTLNGSDVTDIFILETNGTQINIDRVFTAAGQGVSTLSHTIAFDPTKALILGLDKAPAGSGLVDHLVVMMDNDFANYALTKEKFSDIFIALDGRPRVGHNAVVAALINAQAGDAASLNLLSDFFTVDAGKLATFNPNATFRTLEFTGPVAIDAVPEPATMLLFGMGSVGALLRRRMK